jgi:primosomal protein N' (replication factor Y) (superfamily II helicase)
MIAKKITLLRIAVPTPLRQVFDYLPPPNVAVNSLLPGIRVRIPFQNRELVGILLEVVNEESTFRLKAVLEILDQEPVVPADVLQLCLWSANYYHHPVGMVLEAALPILLRQGKSLAAGAVTHWQITAAGRDSLAVETRRAPKQTALLKTLALYPLGMTRSELQELQVSASLLKSVNDKELVEKISRPNLFSAASAVTDFSKLLNEAQANAVNTINAQLDAFKVFLIDGVTGSGKTEVYLQIIEQVIARQRQVLVLVPEIGLTPQTIQRFRQRFAVPVIALHSALNDKERLNAWLAGMTAGAKIIIGTRSAIFSPFIDLGLIIVDEEHDISFKQQEGFRYHARDLAILRAQNRQVPVILGSATPALESIHRAMRGNYHYLNLPERAGSAQMPRYCVVDVRNQYLEEGLSPALLQAMQEHLQNDSQVMLFLNRRGYAPVFMCHACGHMATCKRCDARMTFHHEPRRLHCHHCDSRKPVPAVCEKCDNKDLHIIGLGTERLEQALQKHFPGVSIARIDRDSTQRKGSMENLLDGILSGEHKILIGTQMLAKGHHFPDVSLVGIVDPDGGFFSSDFRAIERMGQLVLQVAGRAGRATRPGTVMIQTHHPEQPFLKQLITENYYRFAEGLLQDREQAALPPYTFLALFRAEAHSMEQALAFLREVKELTRDFRDDVPVWGPVPAPMPRRAGRFRVQLLLQSNKRPMLQHYLKLLLPAIEKIPGKSQVRWSLDVDPLEMF